MRNSEPGPALRIGVVLDGMQAPAWAAWALKAIRAHDELELTLAVISDRAEKSGPRSSSRSTRLSIAGCSPCARRARAGGRLARARGRAHRALAAFPSSGGGTTTAVLRWPPMGPRSTFSSASGHRWPPETFRSSPGMACGPSTSATRAGTAASPRCSGRSSSRSPPPSVLEAVPKPPRNAGCSIGRRPRPTRSRCSAPATPSTGRALASCFGASRTSRPGDGLRSRSRRITGDGGRPPSNADAVRHVARLAGRVTRRRLRRAAFRRQWFLGLRQRRADTLPHEDPTPWHVVSPPVDRYWADPFVFESDGETLVFFEQVRFADGKGELAVAGWSKAAS